MARKRKQLTPEELKSVEEALRDRNLFLQATSREPSDFKAVVLGHTWLESLIERLIWKHAHYPERLDIYIPFTQKLKLAFAFGEVSDYELPPLEFINVIRNRFAHNVFAKLEPNDANRMINSFSGAVRPIVKKIAKEIAGPVALLTPSAPHVPMKRPMEKLVVRAGILTAYASLMYRLNSPPAKHPSTYYAEALKQAYMEGLPVVGE